MILHNQALLINLKKLKMAVNCVRKLCTLFSGLPHPLTQNLQQIRTKWVDARMIRDVKRRKMVTEYAPLRLRLNSLRKNDILPRELQQITDSEMQALPRDSGWMRLQKRCVITSRPRGVVYRWRLSRIMFRHLADYNKLAGVQRAMW